MDEIWLTVDEIYPSGKRLRASDSQCRNRNCPGFDPSILRHSGSKGAANEAVLNILHKKKQSKKIPLYFGLTLSEWLKHGSCFQNHLNQIFNVWIFIKKCPNSMMSLFIAQKHTWRLPNYNAGTRQTCTEQHEKMISSSTQRS